MERREIKPMGVIKNHITIEELRRRGIPVVRGDQFIPKSWISKRPPSLKEVHKRLAKIKGTLAEEIARMREEEG